LILTAGSWSLDLGPWFVFNGLAQIWAEFFYRVF
jgi:hypothetical protein